jgi:hypothetical protein
MKMKNKTSYHFYKVSINSLETPVVKLARSAEDAFRRAYPVVFGRHGLCSSPVPGYPVGEALDGHTSTYLFIKVRPVRKF